MAGLSDLRQLLRSEGWAFLVKHVENQIAARIDIIVLNPLGKLDETLAQEYAKGEVQALRMVTQLPKTLVEQAEQFIKERNDEDEIARTSNGTS